jgi:metal transporter CNNM
MVEVPDVDLANPGKVAKTKLVKKVLGSLLVKSCVLLDPEGESERLVPKMHR